MWYNTPVNQDTLHCEIVYQVFNRVQWEHLVVNKWRIVKVWLTLQLLDLENWNIKLNIWDESVYIPSNKIKFIRYYRDWKPVVIKGYLNKVFDKKLCTLVDLECRVQPETTVKIQNQKQGIRKKWPNKR